MTPEDIENMYLRMLDHFGTLPSVEHEPKRFAYYVKIFKYYERQK